MGKFSISCSVPVALMALLVIVEAKSSAKLSERIYGGERASPGQFPHQVSIRAPWFFDNAKWHVCGGVIISDRFILTAANCTQGDLLFPQMPQLWSVRFSVLHSLLALLIMYRKSSYIHDSTVIPEKMISAY